MLYTKFQTVNNKLQKTSQEEAFLDGFQSRSDIQGIIGKDKERANRIREFAVVQGWFISRSMKNWCMALAKLRRQLKEQESQIDTVLDWYFNRYSVLSNLPKIRNGEELRRTWTWLTDRKYKDRLYDSAQPNISSECLRIIESLSIYSWPGNTKKELYGAVQESLDNMKMFIKKIEAIFLDHRSTREQRQSSALLLDVFSNTVSFVRDYWHEIGKWLSDKRDFRGSLSSLVLSEDIERVKSAVKNQLIKWSGSVHGEMCFNSLWEEVKIR